MSEERTTDRDRCMHFVARKKRYCRMTVRAGKRYCGEHQRDADDPDGPDVAADDRRVKCPLDPTHTCYQSKLTKHLTVCNAKRRMDARPAFIVEGVNLDEESTVAPAHVPLSRLDESIVEAVIRKIHSAHEKLPEFSQDILQHDVLKYRLNDGTCGNRLRKHLLQNASLLGHMEQAGFAQDDTCFIEFGAGKVDRSSHRHKNDNKLKKEESHLAIKRVRADIADLQLNRITEIQSVKHKVGIAKHLCGTATDLAIRCLVRSMNSEPHVNVRGLVLAFCCHHKCEYSSYVGREYLRQCGFTVDEFPILCSIVSWATCGLRSRNDAKTQPDEETTSPQHCEEDNNIVQSSESNERELIGRKAKTLLNWGRLIFLQSVGFQAELFYYTSTDVSLENMCIVATRKSST
ncbi:tRNA:m(4)X modification enzyme TRM13 homolog isoform X2 [Harpegnathos saltator]|uniref:tRNA:m(4)X modification enzyme TRM13 homolog isoform X2 n=1 Tax=Harpegnathos saltator TaxID=610380 RepID=UPI000DBEDC7F|nr:tRNA:m(4)X modification enzyme TRM13 homolog isoform X2 [Harpegnathos saltator]